MPDRQEFRRVREEAVRALARGFADVGLLPRPGRVRSPVPVRDPEGRLHSWFVPVTSGDRLLGFLQFLPNLTLVRSSSFQRRPGTLEGCPDAAAWLDRETIVAHASRHIRSGEQPGRPFLTYDRQPARLVWAVPVIGRGGRTRTIFVAGDHVYEGRRETDDPTSDTTF